MRAELQIFETDLGWMVGISQISPGDGPRLAQLVIGAETADVAFERIQRAVQTVPELNEMLDREEPSRKPSAWWTALRRRLRDYAAGKDVHFDDIAVDLGPVTPFQSRVLACCRNIRRGATISYAELAKAAGRPGAARAVGNVMARNRCPLVIPCHRVLHAGGGLGGFSAPQGLTLKRRLLNLERGRELAKTSA
jgi:methylated-DNA-[protein]-cysteine S-methyltransferase